MTFYLIDGTILTGEVMGTSSERIEIMDEDGNLWSLILKNVVRIYLGKAKRGREK